jgi:hypothetical protein
LLGPLVAMRLASTLIALLIANDVSSPALSFHLPLLSPNAGRVATSRHGADARGAMRRGWCLGAPPALRSGHIVRLAASASDDWLVESAGVPVGRVVRAEGGTTAAAVACWREVGPPSSLVCINMRRRVECLP